VSQARFAKPGWAQGLNQGLPERLSLALEKVTSSSCLLGCRGANPWHSPGCVMHSRALRPSARSTAWYLGSLLTLLTYLSYLSALRSLDFVRFFHQVDPHALCQSLLPTIVSFQKAMRSSKITYHDLLSRQQITIRSESRPQLRLVQQCLSTLRR
jgi:hypothetical protein